MVRTDQCIETIYKLDTFQINLVSGRTYRQKRRSEVVKEHRDVLFGRYLMKYLRGQNNFSLRKMAEIWR